MSRDRSGWIIVISGPSGVGKTTMYKRILKEMSDEVDFSVSATTREPRAGERDGIDYFFLNREDFERRIGEDDFIEWAKVHNQYYGTLKAEINRITFQPMICLLDVDVQGGLSIKKRYPGCYMIFIMPPSIDELKRRLALRQTDQGDKFLTRVNNAISEIQYASQYDIQIVNDDLETAYAQLKAAIRERIDSLNMA